MSKPVADIDVDNIDDDTAAYLRGRPWIIEEYRRQGKGDQMDAVESGDPMKHDPQEDTRVGSEDMRLGTQPQGIKSARKSGVVPDDEEEEDDNYEEWSVSDLKADISLRNEGRDDKDKLVASGTKAELVARLHEDDAQE